MPTTLTARSAPARSAVVLYALLLASLAGRLVLAIWEGPFEGTITVEDAAAPEYWPMHIHLGGPAYTVSFLCTAAFLVVLGRGTLLAWVSALAVGLGGIVFGLVITAEALPFRYATDPAVVPASQARELVAALNDGIGLLLPTILGATAVIALGAVVGLVAVWRARTAPGWFPPAALAGAVLSQVLPAVGLAAPGYLVELAVLGLIGFFGLQVARG